jgi:hypothetical protein
MKEREIEENLQALPIHTIAKRPEHAVEYYKTALSELRQLSMHMEPGQFESAAKEGDRLTATELALWHQIQGKS